MTRIIFRIIEKTFITFDAALQMMDLKETVNHQTLAIIMTECGFFVKYSLFKNEDDEDLDAPPQREYTIILCPYNLPLHIILKLIRAFIRANGSNRRGDPLKDTVANLREQQRAAAKSQQEATQNYWTRQTNRDASSSGKNEDGAMSDIGVVQGYWRQKEQRQVGKLWEQ